MHQEGNISRGNAMMQFYYNVYYSVCVIDPYNNQWVISTAKQLFVFFLLKHIDSNSAVIDIQHLYLDCAMHNHTIVMMCLIDIFSARYKKK